MSHRRLICTRRRREQMDKSSIVGKCRNHIWCVVFSSILFWFLLFYFHSSALISTNNDVRSLQNEYSIAAISRESKSLHVTEKDAGTGTHPPPTENRVGPITGDGIKEQLKKNDIESPNPLHVAGDEAESFNKQIIAREGELSVGRPFPTTENRVETITGDGIKEQLKENNREFPIPLHVAGNEAGSESYNKRIVGVEGEQSVGRQSPAKERGEPIHEPAAITEGRTEPIKIESAVNRLKPNSGETEPVNRLQETRVEPVDQSRSNTSSEIENRSKPSLDPCFGQYVYVHSLPSRFNDDMLKECKSLSKWTDMCRFTSNLGLGPPIRNSQGVFSNSGWYATNQFALDAIFNNRMKQYKCLTNDSSMASAIFVPFYAGFDISRYLWGFNTSIRDSTSFALIKWLKERPEWKVLGGRDHFLVAGRIAWDFRRLTENDKDWGNKLMLLDEAKNMTLLVIESSPWNKNDFAIPYPTYFHPSRDIEVFQWQNRVRRFKRRYLFSFAGAPRPNLQASIRGQIIEQCRDSRRKCKLLDCHSKSCDNPSNLMKVFQSSVFCLQPPGDSYTRRSAFDSMLAGCIPVFFHPGSAYVQYTWHLPQNYTTYSVLIPEKEVREGKVNIEKTLLQIPKSKVREMREQVIRLIPSMIYGDPRSKLKTLEDAFDLTVQGVIKRVDRVRKAIRDGVDPDGGYIDANSWKYNLFGTEEEHEWDHFFSKPWKAISY